MARRQVKEQNYWPGFVDALSNLVLIIVLVLIVFTVTLFYFASQVGVKAATTAQAKATEVVAKAVEVTNEGAIDQAPQELQRPVVKDSDEKKKVTVAMTAAADLLEQISKDLTPTQKAKYKRKIEEVSDKIVQNTSAADFKESYAETKTDSTSENSEALESEKQAKLQAGEAKESSDLTSRSNLLSQKRVTKRPKGGQVLPGRKGLNNGEVLIVGYTNGTYGLTDETIKDMDKVLNSLKLATVKKVSLIAQPSQESYSEAQRLSYFRLISIRNYLLRKGVSPNRIETRIIERPTNPEIKSGAVFMRVVK